MMKNNYKIVLLHCLLFCSTIWLAHAQNGIVVTDRTPMAAVSFSESSKVTNISDSHHVDGYVKKYGANRFVFPVGQNGRYRPFAAEANEVLGAYFGSNPGAATLPQGAPFNPASRDELLSAVSAVEYWDINGINPTRLTLTWNTTSGIADLTGSDLSLLTIAGWNPSTARWEEINSKVDEVAVTGAASSVGVGSVTTTVTVVPDNYHAFTLAKSTSASLPSNYAGTLEVVSCEQIKGWVWDKNYPATSLTVELVDGQTVLGTATANQFREDLKNGGTGTGNYGFSMLVPQSYMGDGVAHQLSVRVRNSTYLLSGSPKSLTCSYGGAFEKIDCYAASGWAWDKNNSNVNQTVELLEGSTVIATLVAKNYRESLKTAGIGTGNYGFDAVFPQHLKDGKIHSISARVKGIGYVLNGSPKNLICPLSSYQGNLEYADCNVIQGWAWDRNYKYNALTVELVEGDVVHATVVANLYQESLKTQGIGTGNYGFRINTPGTLKDGKSHQLGIRVKGTTTVLGTLKTLNCPLNAYQGKLEYADCAVITGWAWDRNFPNNAQTLELVEGNTVYATVLANLYQESLKTQGIGTGNYGFRISTPAALKDGQTHQLGLRVKGTTTILSALKPLTCAVNVYEGNFEQADCNTVSGWAWDRNFPASAVTVELMEGSVVHTSFVANLYKDNLKAAGIGTGNYGFNVALPAVLKDGKPHVLSLRVKGSSTIIGPSKTITCAVNQYQGKLEYADCAVIMGWAWDRNFPDTAQTLEVVEGNTVYATVLANLYQESLKTQGIGTGNYGFRISTPAALKDGQTHQLGLRVKGTTTILSALKPITCPVNVYEGNFEQADCNTVSGWVWDRNFPATAVTVELMEGSVVHTSFVANLYKDNLKAAGIGTGNYGFNAALPAVLKDGKPHVLSLRVKGSSTIIGPSKTITCAVNQYQGKLEYADCAVTMGWAWDRNFPNNAQTLEVVEGNTVFATVLANLYQESLKTQGIGTGNYGFKISTPATLKDGQTHQLGLRVKGTTMILSALKPLTCPVNEYQGKFEQADCNTVSGWVWDRNFPASAVTVELIEGTVVHASAVANIYKDNLKTAGIGTGNYGFKITLPEALKDGKPHILSIRVKGSTIILPNSPLTVTCAATGRLSGEAGPDAEQSAMQPQDEEIGLTFTVFPNPTSGILVAKVGGVAGETAKLSVTNLQGRTVWTKVLTETHSQMREEIDLRGLPDGAYLIKLETKGEIRVGRFVLIQ